MENVGLIKMPWKHSMRKKGSSQQGDKRNKGTQSQNTVRSKKIIHTIKLTTTIAYEELEEAYEEVVGKTNF